LRTLAEALDARLDVARRAVPTELPLPSLAEIGTVERIGDGVATIAGLPGARLDEILVLGDRARALVVSLDPSAIGAVLLDPIEGVGAGAPVRGTGQIVRAPVGEALLGRVVDPLGRPRDGGGPVHADRDEPIERPAPAIRERALVHEPLRTGILAVDSLVPIGRGQRELIVGDRSIGKTSVAVDAMLNQNRGDVVCVYVAIGQKASTIARVVEDVRARGAFSRTIFVVAEASDPPGLSWIAPYAACTMAEFFRDRGEHALIVYDDLSKHAVVHRQISLLLRYPPGREAYPGDVFYIHARLLERAAKLSDKLGGGSLTALPIAETQGGNLSAYIPTNLVSITDGQIYLEPKLFHEGQKPAINVGKSVSRVGGKTQPKILRELSGSLRLEYEQFLELETFTRFGQMVDARTQRTIDRGRRIRAVLSQPQLDPLALSTEVALLVALREGLLDPLPLEIVPRFKEDLERDLVSALSALARRIDESGVLADDDRDKLITFLRARAASLTPPAK